MHRETRVANYVLASLAIISLTLLSLPLSGPVRAFKACSTYVMNPIAYYGDKGAQRFANVPSNIRDLIAADMENRLMLEEIKKATWIQAENDSLKIENGRLRAALSLRSPTGRTPLWAHVMERDPLQWYRSITVDAGTDEGVTVNAPVLGQKGDQVVVIGRVKEARRKDSVVLLVTDDLSAVAAYVASASTETPTDYEGLLQGQGISSLRMNYLPPDAKARVGDMVYTSPTSATFPPDILIGTVSKVLPLDPFLAFQALDVQPAVDASSLREVMILKAQPEAQPLAPAPGKEEASNTEEGAP